MKKYILSLCLVSVLFCCTPIVAKATTQEEIKQQLIATLIQMIAQLQEQIKTILAQQAAQTSVSQNQSEKTDSTATSGIEVSSSESQDLSKIAMEEFLKDPTFENYKAFCVKAKSLQGWGTIKKLNSNKDSVVSETPTLYDSLWDCKLLDNGKQFAVYSLPDDDLHLAFDKNDIDLVRVAKIKYNNELDEVSKKSKFVIISLLNNGGELKNYNVASSIEHDINLLNFDKKKRTANDPIWRNYSFSALFADPISEIRNHVE